jgi:hypothetical protein
MPVAAIGVGAVAIGFAAADVAAATAITVGTALAVTVAVGATLNAICVYKSPGKSYADIWDLRHAGLAADDPRVIYWTSLNRYRPSPENSRCDP